MHTFTYFCDITLPLFSSLSVKFRGTANDCVSSDYVFRIISTSLLLQLLSASSDLPLDSDAVSSPWMPRQPKNLCLISIFQEA